LKGQTAKKTAAWLIDSSTGFELVTLMNQIDGQTLEFGVPPFSHTYMVDVGFELLSFGADPTNE
jgi:hypothetical protein